MNQLRRSLGIFETTLLGVGVMLGAGIYALVGRAAGLAGNAVWLSFSSAAVVAAFTGLSYAELSSFIPRAGGEYHYARRAFGKLVAFLVTWLLIAGVTVAGGAVALGFGGYLSVLVGTPTVTGGALLLLGVCALLVWGIRESAWFAGFCTFLEVGGLVAIIAFGVPHLGEVDLLDMPHGLAGVGAASSLTFFAYIGFEEIVQLAEETKNPTRNIPLALVLSLGVTTVLYVLVSLAAISVLGWELLGASDSPLADVAEAAVGAKTSATLAIIALFSTANTVLVLLLSGSRLVWGMAEDGVLPNGLARVHTTRRTPWVATAAVSLGAALVAVALADIEAVAQLTNLAIFITFMVINAAVVGLRFREPDVHRPFRLPFAVAGVPLIPVAGMVSVGAMMTQVPPHTWMQGFVVLALGGLVWWRSHR